MPQRLICLISEEQSTPLSSLHDIHYNASHLVVRHKALWWCSVKSWNQEHFLYPRLYNHAALLRVSAQWVNLLSSLSELVVGVLHPNLL